MLIDNDRQIIVAADDAWERHRRIVDLRNQVEQTFLQLGEELYWFEDEKQYRDLDYDTFEQYLGDPEVSISRTVAFRLKGVYQTFVLKLEVPVQGLLEAGHSKLDIVRPHVTPWIVNELVADAAALSCSDCFTKYSHRTSDRDDYSSDDWHTPAQYIEAAREVMGDIDLDPATCDTAQEVVQAGAFFTKEMEGLDRQWHGRVWLNPPYSMPSIAYFVAKVLDEYDQGHITEAIVLVNNSSDTKWFHRLLDRHPACFTTGRVQFWHPDYKTFATRQGQTFFYLGQKRDRFKDVFSQFGIVVGRL